MERAHSSPTVLLGVLSQYNEFTRKEVIDTNGNALTIEIYTWRETFVAPWRYNFQRTLRKHEASRL